MGITVRIESTWRGRARMGDRKGRYRHSVAGVSFTGQGERCPDTPEYPSVKWRCWVELEHNGSIVTIEVFELKFELSCWVSCRVLGVLRELGLAGGARCSEGVERSEAEVLTLRLPNPAPPAKSSSQPPLLQHGVKVLRLSQSRKQFLRLFAKRLCLGRLLLPLLCLCRPLSPWLRQCRFLSPLLCRCRPLSPLLCLSRLLSTSPLVSSSLTFILSGAAEHVRARSTSSLPLSPPTRSHKARAGCWQTEGLEGEENSCRERV